MKMHPHHPLPHHLCRCCKTNEASAFSLFFLFIYFFFINVYGCNHTLAGSQCRWAPGLLSLQSRPSLHSENVIPLNHSITHHRQSRQRSSAFSSHKIWHQENESTHLNVSIATRSVPIYLCCAEARLPAFCSSGLFWFRLLLFPPASVPSLHLWQIGAASVWVAELKPKLSQQRTPERERHEARWKNKRSSPPPSFLACCLSLSGICWRPPHTSLSPKINTSRSPLSCSGLCQMLLEIGALVVLHIS